MCGESVEQGAVAGFGISIPHFDSVVDGSGEDSRASEVCAEDGNAVMVACHKLFGFGHYEDVFKMNRPGGCAQMR